MKTMATSFNNVSWLELQYIGCEAAIICIVEQVNEMG